MIGLLLAIIVSHSAVKPAYTESMFSIAGVTFHDNIDDIIKKLGHADVDSGGDAGNAFARICYCNQSVCAHFDSGEMGYTTLRLDHDTTRCAKTTQRLVMKNGVRLGMARDKFETLFSKHFKETEDGRLRLGGEYAPDQLTQEELVSLGHKRLEEYSAFSLFEATFEDGKLARYLVRHLITL